MKRSAPAFLGLLAALGFVATAEAQFSNTASNKELEVRANQADARIGTLEGRVNQSLLDLQRQIEAGQQELRSLRGRIEEARRARQAGVPSTFPGDGAEVRGRAART